MIDRTIKNHNDMINFLSEDEKRKQAEMFFNFAKENQLKIDTKTTAKFYSFSFYPLNSSRALFKMDINKDTLRIKAQMFFIEKHIEDFHKVNRDIIEAIIKTPQCTMCSLNCKQGVRFSLQNENYFSCINEGHYFKDLSEDAAKDLIWLLMCELNVINSIK